jgi:hypothetical protein
MDMISRIKVLVLFLLVSCTTLFSQQLSHQVLVPVAGVSSNSTISYSQTIGETAVEIISSSEYTFTQGFQQPCIKFSKEAPPPGNGVKVYPNPVTDILNIELFGEEARTFKIELITISGTIVKSEKIVFSGPYWKLQEIAVDSFSKGLFFVRIISDDGVINRTFKIDKM